jgi:hypothetical protein
MVLIRGETDSFRSSPHPGWEPCSEEIHKEAESIEKQGLEVNTHVQIADFRSEVSDWFLKSAIPTCSTQAHSRIRKALLLLFSLIRKRLIYKHHRDILLDGINQSAGFTD